MADVGLYIYYIVDISGEGWRARKSVAGANRNINIPYMWYIDTKH